MESPTGSERPSTPRASARRNAVLLYAGAGIRAFTIGASGILLGLYLAQLGSGAATLGVVVGLGLAGNAAGTALVALAGGCLDRRKCLILTALLSGGGLVALSLARGPTWLGVAAFFGMANGMGRDRGPGQTLEQSLLTDAAPASAHARLFARYALVQDVLGGLGSLAAAVPSLLARLPALDGSRWTLAFLGGVSLIPALCYLRLPRDGSPSLSRERKAAISTAGKRRVARLALLFALDSLGGGFLAGSILSYWFFQRFGLQGDVLGPLFFVARALNALSYLAAERLAAQIGLIRTMVFTHIPSSLLILALPFAGSPLIAIALFLGRESLVQMDVPTRQAYVTTATRPEERTFALGITGLTRNIG